MNEKNGTGENVENHKFYEFIGAFVLCRCGGPALNANKKPTKFFGRAMDFVYNIFPSKMAPIK